MFFFQLQRRDFFGENYDCERMTFVQVRCITSNIPSGYNRRKFSGNSRERAILWIACVSIIFSFSGLFRQNKMKLSFDGCLAFAAIQHNSKESENHTRDKRVLPLQWSARKTIIKPWSWSCKLEVIIKERLTKYSLHDSNESKKHRVRDF